MSVGLSLGAASQAYAVGESAAPAASTVPVGEVSPVHNQPNTQFRVAKTEGLPLRLRDAPSLNAQILARLPEGTVVTLAAGAATEADGERWLPIQADQTRGWVAAHYLVRVVPLTPVVRQLPANASFADRVVATAETFIGQPYVWSGNQPGGFDCSGFVQWVYSQLGVRMPRLIPDQLAMGTKIEPSALQPGDLVAFKDTYQPGISHVGIYLGSNRFVSAVDEAYGVSTSDLTDDYWKPRFYQAVRIRS